jgi:hypothetical protein
MEACNLLAERDMYQLSESTFLRNQLVIIREVTGQRTEIVALGRNPRDSSSTTRSGETLTAFIRG